MASSFDPDAYLSLLPNPASTGSAAPPAVANGFDPDAYLKSKVPVDPTTGELPPRHADGLSPNTPINTSPLDLTDRFKLALGNKKGSIDYLKQKFPDASEDSEGNLVVKNNDGLFYRVDPTGLGADSWSSTRDLMAKAKEGVADLVDVIPDIAKVGAGIAGSAAGTLGGGPAGTVLGGATLATGMEAARQSLGRLVGTYSATPEEQGKDLALEMALNLGGGFIGLGVKPTAGYLANKLGPIGKQLSEAAPGVKDLVAKVLGPTSGVGEQNMYRLMERPDAVQGALKAAKTAGASDVTDTLQQQSISGFKEMVSKVQPALSKMYNNLTKTAAESVPADFQGSVREIADGAFSKLEEMGLGKLDGSKFKLFNDKELGSVVDRLLQSGDPNAAKYASSIQQLIGNDGARGIINKGINVVERQAAAMTGTSEGKAAAMKLLGFKRSINGILSDLSDEALNTNATSAKQFIGVLEGHIENGLLQKFEQRAVDGTITNPYQEVARQYAQAKNAVQPMLSVQKAAIRAGSDVPYEQGLNQMLAGTGKNIAKKSAMDSAIDLVSAQGDKSINLLKDGILDQQAAKSFIPMFNKGIASKIAAGGGVGAAVATGHAGALLSPLSAVAGLAMSPKAVGMGVGGMSKASNAMVDAGFRGLDFLKNVQGVGQMKSLLQSEPAMQQYFRTILTAPQIQDQVKGQLMNRGGQGQ